jgi:hypothetical protein
VPRGGRDSRRAVAGRGLFVETWARGLQPRTLVRCSTDLRSASVS